LHTAGEDVNFKALAFVFKLVGGGVRGLSPQNVAQPHCETYWSRIRTVHLLEIC